MAFNWEHAGSSLAVLPIDDSGRKSKTMPLLHGHTDTVTDLHFSPFHDGLLATGSQDCLVSWNFSYGRIQNIDDFFFFCYFVGQNLVYSGERPRTIINHTGMHIFT